MSPVMHSTIASFRALRRSLQGSIGFVPTMGALHEGHLSLVKAARAQNDIVVASIFVNPTQFGVGEDFDKYPRQLEQDAALLKDYGVDHLFAPHMEEMYGKNHLMYVEPEGFDDLPEGKSRPGHFRGVATIVLKLLNIVQPTNSYFGQKDAVQCCLIRRLVEDLNVDSNINIMDTVREDDGLAMSSRNAYLTAEERKAAPIIHRALSAAQTRYMNAEDPKHVESAELRSLVESTLREEPLISEIQYVTIDSKENMHPTTTVGPDGAVISLACKMGSVRLIDNIVL